MQDAAILISGQDIHVSEWTIYDEPLPGGETGMVLQGYVRGRDEMVSSGVIKRIKKWARSNTVTLHDEHTSSFHIQLEEASLEQLTEGSATWRKIFEILAN